MGMAAILVMWPEQLIMVLFHSQMRRHMIIYYNLPNTVFGRRTIHRK